MVISVGEKSVEVGENLEGNCFWETVNCLKSLMGSNHFAQTHERRYKMEL